MNDISVKIIDVTKEQVLIHPEHGTGNESSQSEVDPLAIDESICEKDKDPLKIEDSVKKEVGTIKSENCDENEAKEVSIKDEVVEETILAPQVDNIEENLIEETTSINGTADDKPTTLDNNKYDKEIPVDKCDMDKHDPSAVPHIEPEPVATVDHKVSESNIVNEVVNQVAVNIVAPGEVEVKIEPEEKIVEEKNKEDNTEQKVADVEMIEVKEDKTDNQADVNDDNKPVNGDCSKEDSKKRRPSEDVEADTPLKKLCLEIERTYPSHDAMINDYIQNSTKANIDEIQRHTEQLLAEIQTLRELAQKKEHEWNNILHLKKVKEEVLLRLLRQKQVLSYEKSAEINGTDRPESFDFLNHPKNFAIDKNDEISGMAIKQPGPPTNNNPPIQAPVMPVSTHYTPMPVLPPPYDKAAHLHNVPKNMYPGPMMLPGPTMPGFPRDMNGQLQTSFGLPMGRQGPTKDVKSIIADYRQRNPDITPRRGRRMKSVLNPNMMNPPRPIAPKLLDSMNNFSNLGMMFNNFDMNQKAMLERLSQIQTTNLPNGLSFKDVLVQFANMQQQHNPSLLIRPEMMPNRPPEHHQIRPTEPRSELRNVNRRMDKPSMHTESEVHVTLKQSDRLASASPRLPPPPPYPEISLLPVSSSSHEQGTSMSQQNSLLHGILTKQGTPATQSYSPTLAKLLTSPERKQNTPTLPSFGQAKSCGEITITPVQPAHQVVTTPAEGSQEKHEDVVQLDDEESAVSDGEGSASAEGEERRLVIDESGAGSGGPGSGPSGAGAGPSGGSGASGGSGGDDTPLCQGCRRRDAQFVCAGCANQWYCSRDCQVAAWDEHSEMCSG